MMKLKFLIQSRPMVLGKILFLILNVVFHEFEKLCFCCLYLLCLGFQTLFPQFSSQVVLPMANHSCWCPLDCSELVSMHFEGHCLKLGIMLQLMP